MSQSFEEPILAALDRLQAGGRTARFWLRDDDAVAPTQALDRLLALTAAHGVPLTLAVIPEPAGSALQQRLAGEGHVTVAVHGWAHSNHAAADAKKAELGADRPAETVTAELAEALEKLRRLFGPQLLPVLVPPWNRIDTALIAALPALGFQALSVYGAETSAPLPVINTHVDVMDWHGTRGCRDVQVLAAEIVARLDDDGNHVGLLTHHLVHDEDVWVFLARLFEATERHPACRWVGLSTLLAR
ncbi:polysaccharide deacetylase family protein [Rhizobium sp. YIM 134829]|uniref:polysaccharide deacetylase family protein n=1 Tax=Rhizobium sp. YIM 134829 TaxID=3390453 RepID=UPI0039789444